jgi:hypothetical protein
MYLLIAACTILEMSLIVTVEFWAGFDFAFVALAERSLLGGCSIVALWAGKLQIGCQVNAIPRYLGLGYVALLDVLLMRVHHDLIYI